jgi:hypothetical protein
MFGKHVSNLTSAYCHDELPPEKSQRVAEHLISCLRCRAEFEEIKFGVKLAEQLPLVPAPDSLWGEIERALDRNALPARSRDRWRMIQILKGPGFVVPALATIVLIAMLAAFWMRRTPTQTSPGWNVARLDGAPRINSTQIGDNGSLAVGQWLETDGTSRAKLDVGNIGQVEIDPNTRVRLIETKPTEHRLELARGRMSARIAAPPKLFFVNTPSGVAEDLGCAYTLEVDDGGNSLLRVTTGWVSLQLKDRESRVPAGAACATKPGIGPGTPYFEDSTASFRAALTKVDFESDATDRNKSLESLLSSARVRDTFTLWNLLGRVDRNDRLRVYERMVELAPPPQGVTREGVLALNQQMLDAWKDKLELSWSDYSSPIMKSWRKVWSSGLGKFHGLESKR